MTEKDLKIREMLKAWEVGWKIHIEYIERQQETQTPGSTVSSFNRGGLSVLRWGIDRLEDIKKVINAKA